MLPTKKDVQEHDSALELFTNDVMLIWKTSDPFLSVTPKWKFYFEGLHTKCYKSMNPLLTRSMMALSLAVEMLLALSIRPRDKVVTSWTRLSPIIQMYKDSIIHSSFDCSKIVWKYCSKTLPVGNYNQTCCWHLWTASYFRWLLSIVLDLKNYINNKY